jgi:hypothetical protein
MIKDVKSFFDERKVMEIFLSKLLPSDVVWDVGASFGVYSIFAAVKSE